MSAAEAIYGKVTKVLVEALNVDEDQRVHQDHSHTHIVFVRTAHSPLLLDQATANVEHSLCVAALPRDKHEFCLALQLGPTGECRCLRITPRCLVCHRRAKPVGLAP
jgi:hypothetical protein